MYPDGGLEIGSFACTERDDHCRNRADGNNAFPIWEMRAFLRGLPWYHANVLNVAFDHIFHTHFSVAINGIHFRIFLFLVAFRFFDFSVFHLWFDFRRQMVNLTKPSVFFSRTAEHDLDTTDALFSDVARVHSRFFRLVLVISLHWMLRILCRGLSGKF